MTTYLTLTREERPGMGIATVRSGIPRLNGMRLQTTELKRGAARSEDDLVGCELPIGAEFEPAPVSSETKRDCIMVAGASGCGKTYYCAMYIRNYQAANRDAPVYVVSKVKTDPVLDEIEPKLRRLEMECVTQSPPLTADDFGRCLVLFDDVDTFTGKEEASVRNLMDCLLTTGRHSGTSIMVATHHLTNYSRTRLLLNECNWYVVFPQATAHAPLAYLLRTYFGLTSDAVSKLRLPRIGRWVALHKNSPQILLTSSYAKLLNPPEEEGGNIEEPREELSALDGAGRV